MRVCVCVRETGVKSGAGGTSSCLGGRGSVSQDLRGTFSCDWLMSRALLSAL